MNTINQKIFIAGHNGFIGKSIHRKLSKLNYEIITATRNELDLNDFHRVTLFFEKHKPKFVVLAAGKVGGILLNKDYPSDLINQNLSIQLNVLRAAHHSCVDKLIFYASSCIYPRECSVAMDESYLLSSKPEISSLSYAVAKIAGVQMCLAFNQQYGVNKFIPIIPNSGYGPNDNFNPETGHVISSLIARFHYAKLNNLESKQSLNNLNWLKNNSVKLLLHILDKKI